MHKRQLLRAFISNTEQITEKRYQGGHGRSECQSWIRQHQQGIQHGKARSRTSTKSLVIHLRASQGIKLTTSRSPANGETHWMYESSVELSYTRITSYWSEPSSSNLPQSNQSLNHVVEQSTSASCTTKVLGHSLRLSCRSLLEKATPRIRHNAGST